ncbi:MAG: response regulator [Polyangiaceae bacterium]
MGGPTPARVDDEFGMRATTSANFELEGFVVAEAASGEEALARLGAEAFDVVLTDIRMPGITGIELFRALRARGDGTPVILMTAFHDDQPTRRALEDGAFTLLAKPFDMSTAFRVVANAARRPVGLATGPDADRIVSHLEQRGNAARRVDRVSSAEALLGSERVDVCVIDLDADGDEPDALIELARRRAVSVVGVAESLDARVARVDAVARKQAGPSDIVLAIARVRGAPR